MKTQLFTFFFLIAQVGVFAQSLTQTIRGNVVDQQSGMGIPGATVIIIDSDPIKGTTTDFDGNFTLTDVPVGRVSLQLSFIGYKAVVLSNLTVNSGKELVLTNIEMLESVSNLQEVVITAEGRKDEVINDMVTTSARTLSLDEASRFAGAAFDPARMAANFAGVTTSGDLRNDIVVRGNSPGNILYRIEGIPSPNPNHFGTYGGAGGAVSMISQNMLDKSDFITSAFPAEYGNVNGGVFDINFRKGNSENHEYTGLFSFRGAELTAEGPLKIGKGASYLVNYRYSTLGIFDVLGLDIGVPAVPNYQDVSFKVDIPTGGKAGRFTFFGIGGIADINLNDSELEDPEEYFNQDQPADVFNETRMGFTGLTHTHFFGTKTTGKATIAYSNSRDIYSVDTLNRNDFFQTSNRNSGGTFNENRVSAVYKLRHKINAKNTIQAGTFANFHDLDFDEKTTIGGEYQSVNQFDGNSQLVNSYVNYTHRFTDNLVLNAGLHHTYFDISNSSRVEPRAGLKWNIADNQALSLGFGMHSQILPQYAYFIQEELADGSIWMKNQNLDLQKSNHYVIGYDWNFTENWRVKAEVYYQDLYDIAVESTPSAFSAINTGADFNGFPDNLGELENTGTGYNTGLELTVEKFFSNQSYILFTSSLFDSRYVGSDGIERNTAFDQEYAFNFLVGKEWNVGKEKNNILGLNLKSNLIGGRRYTPIDVAASQATQSKVLLADQTFEGQHDDYFRTDIRVSYTINKPKVSHQIAFDIQNVTNNQNIFQQNYNVSTNAITTEYQQGFLPDIQYRILF